MSFVITNKVDRKFEVENFYFKYGSGKKGLTEHQKNARIEKILGTEAEKVYGFGSDKTKGIVLFKNADKINKPKFDKDGAKDQLPDEVINNIDNYPNSPFEQAREKRCKILNIKIRDNGCLEMDGIVLNGKELNLKERTTWGVSAISDKELAKLEMKQFNDGILKEVSDRTMTIHEENLELDCLLDDPGIDTNEDKPTQY